MKAWRAHQFGGPDVLQLDDVPIPEPGPGHIRVKCSTITLNFNDIDIIHGTYPDVMPPLPFIPGMENLGVVDACGPGAESWMGKRVVTVPADAYGGYAACLRPACGHKPRHSHSLLEFSGGHIGDCGQQFPEAG